MLWLKYAFLPFTEKKYMLRLFAKNFHELQANLSYRQLQHVKKFRQPEMRTLRLLARKLALSHAEISDILDMDNSCRSVFITNPTLKIAFSYEKNLAVCAFYRSEKNFDGLIALDIENSKMASVYHSSRMDWYAKCLKKTAYQQGIYYWQPLQTQKLWLAQECLTKLYGFPAALSSLPRLVEHLDKEIIQLACPFPFQARFILWKSFIFCLASSQDIFNKSQAIPIDNAKFPHPYIVPRIFRFPTESKFAWQSRGTGAHTLQFP